MKNEKLQDAIGEVSEELIEEAANYKRPKHRALKLSAVIAATLCISLLCLAVFMQRPDPEAVIPQNEASEDVIKNESASESLSDLGDFYLCKAEYPEQVQNPNIDENQVYDEALFDIWHNDQKTRRDAYYELDPDISDFVKNSTQSLVKGEDNKIYSPINVYMALSLLAESTDGNSRNEILSALGCDSIEALRREARVIWDACYHNDGASNTLLGNSLWLNDNVNYKKDTLDLLCDNYYASSFQGEMGSPGMDIALRQWLNEQTGNLLEDQINGLSFTPDTVLGLASTVYFNAQWSNKFDPENTAPALFNSPEGEITCDFMNESSNGTYFTAENFTAIAKDFNEVGSMLLILPDEDSSVDEVIASDELYDFINCNGRGDTYASEEDEIEYWPDSKFTMINLSIPKFDVSSQLDLTSSLYELGINDVFDSEKADFSPITETDGVTLGDATHGARVKIDEEGCEAAAYTLFLCGSALPRDEIDFVLDRPFIFVINSTVGVPLFVGTVYNP